MLLSNMRSLEIDPTLIEIVLISHAHGDHTGGLEGLLTQGVRPTVYLLPSFSQSYKDQIAQTTTIVEVHPGQSLAADVHTTGEMGDGIPEQALVIKTTRGLVVVTGCAHPGIVQIIEKAKELFGEPVHLVMGGFHLRQKGVMELESILAEFRRLGVERVAPCHCTGDRAIEKFQKEYEQDFIEAGVGRVIVVEL